MRPRQLLPFLLLVAPGSACFLICLWHALQDWAALQQAQARFQALAVPSQDIGVLFAAERKRNIHRVNLLAEGAWALLGAIIAAIGVHGLCVNRGTSGGPGHPL